MPRKVIVSRRAEDRIVLNGHRPSAAPDPCVGEPLTPDVVERGLAQLTDAESELIRAETRALERLFAGRQFGPVSAQELLAAVGRWLNANVPVKTP